MSDHRSSLSVLLLGGLLAASLAAPLLADYRESYRRGLEARDRGDWATVASAMSSAAAEQPASGERIEIRGSRSEVYLPHFYLGRALFELGDCAGAMAAWGRAESQGVIQGQPQYRILTEGVAVCRQRLPPPPAAPAVPEEPGGTTAEPPAGEVEGEGAGATPEGPEPAGPQAQAAEPAEVLEAEPVTLPPSTPPPPPPPPSPQPKAKTAPPPERRPPAALRAAAEAFLEGSYARVVEVLADIRLGDRRADAAAHLLRAAARHALFRAGGEEDAELLAAARRDVAACRRLAPGLTPGAHFSPAFAALFAEPAR